MPLGKPAGVRCVQLTEAGLCCLFGLPERPLVCRSLRPQPAMCGTSRAQALAILTELELATLPATAPLA
jgi:uncharacterized protein